LEDKYNNVDSFRTKVDKWILEQEIDKNWSWLSNMDKDKKFKSYVTDILEREGISISSSVKAIQDKLKKDLSFKQSIEKALRENEMPTDWLDKLASEGAYTLINRILFLRMCEDRGFISKRMTNSWLEMLEESTSFETIMHLKSIFAGMASKFPQLYDVPLFDNIILDDLDWEGNSISMVVGETLTHSFSEISRDVIGDVYQHHVPKEVRKALGQFYTAQSIVSFILDEISQFITAESKIIDPSCGSGSFLLSSYNNLREIIESKGTDSSIIHPYIVTNCLAGIDIDSFAAQLSLMNIILKDLDHHQKIARSKIFIGNSLDVGLSPFLNSTTDLSSTIDYNEIKDALGLLNYGLREGFDIVVGNPPHGNVSSKNPLYRYALKTHFSDIVGGVTNFASMFIKRGIELLKKDGKGILAFIMPKSFTYTKAFKAARDYVKRNCEILNITDLGKAWDEVGLEQVIIIIRKLAEDESLPNSKIKIISEIKDIDFIELEQYNTHYVDLNRFYDSAIFPLYLTDEMDPILKKIVDNSIPLGMITENFRGFGVQSKSTLCDEKPDDDWVPIVSGSNVKRWYIEPDFKWIKFDDPNIASSKNYKQMFSDRIVVMNLISSKVKIDAAFDNSFSQNDYPNMNLDTVNNIVLKNDYRDKYDYLYILGFLNSNLATVFIRDFIFNRAELTMHADAPYLDSIPIASLPIAKQKKIVNIVSEIITLETKLKTLVYDLETHSEYNSTVLKLKGLKLKLNNFVYHSFNLSEEEIRIFEERVEI